MTKHTYLPFISVTIIYGNHRPVSDPEQMQHFSFNSNNQRCFIHFAILIKGFHILQSYKIYTMRPKKEKIIFIINPGSGGRSDLDWEAQIHEHEAMVKFDYLIYKITGKNASLEIKLEIERFHPDKVIAVGGDGTISMVAKIILGTDIIMGIIPAGSANGMAKELDIPVNLKDSLEIIFSGKKIAIDVITIN